MPENKVRKSAAKKKHAKQEHELEEIREEKKKVASVGSRRWVPPTFITVGLLGVIWILTYYIAGKDIKFMSDLGLWNMAIGFGLMISSFIIMTFWK